MFVGQIGESPSVEMDFFNASVVPADPMSPSDQLLTDTYKRFDQQISFSFIFKLHTPGRSLGLHYLKLANC